MKTQKLHSNPHGRLVRRAIFSLFIGAVAWAAPVARAQYTSNYQTNTYDGAAASVNWTNGSYTVGNANHDDVLWVLNGAGLTNTGAGTYGMIGSLIAGGSNNLAVVSGSGSLWTNVGAFYVGYSAGSAGNQLILTNGGRVVNAAGELGHAASASNNLAVVGDSGTLWINTSTLAVGVSGSGNQLILTNGGQVMNTAGTLGSNASASNNLVVVNGSGSLWTNTGTLTIGSGGSGNQLILTNGGRVVNTIGYVGSSASSSNNLVVVSGSGTLWNNTNTLAVGESGFGNQLMITESGRVVNTIGYVGHNAGSISNSAVVSGSGSLWSNASDFYVGYSGSGNQLILTNGGRVVNAAGYMGFGAGAINNSAVVSGSGSLWTNTGNLLVGYNAPGNQLIITNGGRVVNSTFGELGFGIGASNTLGVVSGSGSFWNNAGQLYVGNSSAGNQLFITDGGQVMNVTGYMGFAASASNNLVMVSGSGSLWTNTGTLNVGSSGSGNQLIIANGGRVVAGTGFIGSTDSASNNVLVVSDGGSIWNNVGGTISLYGGSGNQLIVSNGGSVFTSFVRVGQTNGANGNAVRIESGGLLEANTLTMAPVNPAFANGNGNSITNFGGIFQFSTFAPTITTNATLGGGGSIVLTNGTIAFRNVNNVDVKNNWSGRELTNIIFQGANIFRLNMASNATSGQAYVFDQGRGATNYVGLEMINGGTAWRGGNLTIGSGGTMLVSNTTASVAGLFSNQGTVRVVNSVVAWSNNVVISGSYLSDPSTNTYITNVTVTASGALSGSNGDLFVFYQNFANQSTNRAQFDLSRAAVLFSNGVAGVTNHTFDMTGSGAVDMGSSWLNVTQLATNFSIGTLSIAGGNHVTFMGSNFISGITNALYVGWLDLTAWNTNASALSTTLSNALTLTDINLYYDAGDARNAYLQDASYALWGSGGLLIPIPEPSTAGLILGGALFSAWLLRRKRNEK